MEGIEILSVGEIGINPVLFNWSAAIIGGILLGLVCALGAGAAEDSVGLFIVAFILCALFFGALCGFGIEKYADTAPTYKVIISDTVSLNEFYDKYEILEQDGKIFTIMERND